MQKSHEWIQAKPGRSRWPRARPRQVLGAALLLVLMGTGSAPAEVGEGTPTLDMFNQLALEKLALHVLSLPSMQEQRRATELLYREHWLAKTADGQARLENAAKATALFSIQFAILNDPARPNLMWSLMPPHRWHGVDWPGSGIAIDNPDNLYRWLVIDGSSRYEISGQRSGSGPIQESFLFYSELVGTGKQTLEGAPVVASLVDDNLSVEADGAFTVAVGKDGLVDPKATHVQAGADARFVFVRDTLSDWRTQFPSRLRVRRTDGPPAAAPRGDEALAEEARSILKAEAPYWLTFFDANNYHLYSPNAKPVLNGRSGGWGLVSSGWFKLQGDEALVVTLDRLNAAYLGFQIADPWGVTPDYIDHTASLNNSQAKPSGDGTFTYVISPQDPGVWNWLDTRGMHMGLFTIRWQRLSQPVSGSEAGIRQMSVVKLSDLAKALPPDMKRISGPERRAQLSDRRATFQVRLGN
jgi:hypothetical protein